MTRQRNDNHSTEFGLWLRQLEAPLDSKTINAQNLDFIWSNYRQNWFILLEEKRYGAGVSPAQARLHGIVDKMLRYASECVVDGQKQMEYRGYYVIRFSHTNPDDSEWIWIGGTQTCDSQRLIHLLTHGRLPEAH